MKRSVRWWIPVCAAVAFASVGSGCDSFQRPNKPVPATFLARTLDGGLVSASDLRGKPWVVNLWLPN